MFTFVDGVVAVVLLLSAGFAYLRGFVHEVLAIGAWAGAAFATWWGFPLAQPWFRSHIAKPLIADGVEALALFLIALLVLSLVTRAISEQVRKSALNSVDSSLGFVFGLARGALVLSAAYLALLWMVAPGKPPAWMANARTRPWLERGALVVASALPQGFGKKDKKPGEGEPGAEPPADGEPGADQPQDDATGAAPPHATGNLEEDVRAAARLLEGAPPPTQPQPAVQSTDAAPDAAKASDAAKSAKRGYDKDQRREMDRLFQTNK